MLQCTTPGMWLALPCAGVKNGRRDNLFSPSGGQRLDTWGNECPRADIRVMRLSRRPAILID